MTNFKLQTSNSKRHSPLRFVVWSLELTAVALSLAASLAVSACSAKPSGPPAIEIDRTACSHCGMLISEPLYAAAYQTPRAEARVFDDIQCLREAARTESRSEE